jgi:ketosteroid isomerase-like protein
MAAANVELVRSIYAAWERGDFSSVEWAHPNIEYVFVDGPSPGRWTGVAGMREASHAWVSAWEDWRASAEEVRELDEERVLVLFRLSGRGKSSGLDVGQVGAKGAGVLHVRDGKVTKLICWWDRRRGFADLGLAPEAGSP